MKRSYLRMVLFAALLTLSAGSYVFLASSAPQTFDGIDQPALEQLEETDVSLPDLTLMRKVYQWTKELIYMI